MNKKTFANATTLLTSELQHEETGIAPSVAPPKFIKVVITEEDRQNAQDYCRTGSCLIATALKRNGFPVYAVGPINVSFKYNDAIIDFDFDLDCGLETNLDYNYSATPPFYKSSVVGKVISCTQREW